MKKYEILHKIFDIQKKINPEKLNLSLLNKQKHTKETILSIIAETTELLREINWASWKIKKEIIQSNVKEEIIDIFKFLMNLCLIWELTPEQFMEEFERKSEVVEQRLKQNKILKGLKTNEFVKICAVDLDGVLVDYPKCWIDFVNKKLKTKFSDLGIMRNYLKKDIYLKLKHEYRISGYKQNLSLKKGAKNFIDNLRKRKYVIVILTKRPYKKYARIFADTKINLDKNKIKYDVILFDEKKHYKIVKELPNIKFMIEDNRRIANEISSWGYRCYLLNNKYNQGAIGDNVIRVNNFNQIKENIK